MELIDPIIRFFQEGGLFMYPILLIFAGGLAIAIERWVYLSLVTGSNKRTWKRVLPLLNSGDFNEAMNAANKSKTAIGTMLTYGLARARTARRRDDVEVAMEEGLMEAIPRMEKRTHYLSTLANIATLLGLLGTIIGLIQAFTAVSNADPAEKADLLSASISVAMNTTAFGLMAAIPLLLVYALLQSKTTSLVDSLEMASVKFLNIFNEKAFSASARSNA
ncbi:MAG: MotA/TolQ/ExbB proton channel family protein [Candidatus Thiodiazotropha sp. (ex Semelilucina semeliformis)]|nr:MotA/TolQ/ExbB proton channel family protein [Candidatus Thiodiazotropha sp. (ex Myrtea spinifera)]MCU7807913.1 MotA/TolQ/ExbB proton channel family protein [Candidatus Thiodiazotropha sp. (ex Semelilucina semeliformis)]MCU7809716.1 MotA/TolQ/ExbB proton channel family protein [Candidatus Thiodiazotropha sp. (ex Notomyrtea botanica)]MCU7827610.1 MotA/TolQ/ExbB proton channel family protein [Candidatus Thiodiazotropha sp. (ex Myrtea sp. 'scaly one' KF741663)]MCU7853489.1 MotA/TolQ/ExbB proton